MLNLSFFKNGKRERAAPTAHFVNSRTFFPQFNGRLEDVSR
jgi:hypothetical protein